MYMIHMMMGHVMYMSHMMMGHVNLYISITNVW